MKPEELAQWVIDNRYPKGEYNKVSDFEMFHFIVSNVSIPIEPPVILPERNSFGQWIDIKDELPPFGKGILVTDNEHIICCELEKSGKDIWLDGHNFGGYEWEWDEIFRYENIKKWMPLPKL